MITQENFRLLLQKLDFKEEKSVFSKHFPQNDCWLKVDFDKKILIYPEDRDLKVNERQTCNFSSAENFVVFECVHRLLEKGYLPQHIELEPKWKVGHGASGGRADILVYNQEKKPLLLIECKTAGNEFTKAWKYMLQDGGQLFSYAQQIQETEFLCLYASDFDEKTNQISIEKKIISHKDNPKILAEDSKLKAFKEATDIKERYKVWKETYKLEFTEIGIFEENIPAYTIGKEKYTLADLSIIAEKDIQKKYHEFATILRQYNISGRENAFDKLVNLFLAKIVDEKHNGHNLQFRWRGIASDNYFDFIDRLEKLYTNGMKEFLKEDVTFVEKQNVIDAFKFFKNDPNSTVQAVLNHFKKQKYFTNNDFSFIDVHNEGLFYQNVVVLRKMVQMIENIQLNGDQQNQFLGDLFEGFLDRGVKQSEGQFFTPMPIVKFILMSLPLEEIVKKSQEIPKAIDYACGAGHFLTELAAQLKPIVAQYKTDITPKDYYRNLYGIEKEYRLSKVAKVSAFMYSQDDIQIFYRDALTKHDEIKEGSYDILVANPPFAVKGFLETLDEDQRKQFALTEHVSDLVKNNAIQCFFLERAKQLLKVGGIVGIIVPSTILSNSDTTHIATREMLLQHFDFVALVEFGSRTFGKTGTNTVVLFLRKKDNNPAPHIHYKERIDSWFSGRDEEKQQVFDDKHFLHKYCQYLEIKTEDYLPLLTAFDDLSAISKLLEYEVFKDYKNAFQKTADKLKEAHQKQVLKLRKDLKSKFTKITPALSAEEIEEKISEEITDLEEKQAKELQKEFIKYLQAIERDKLYYFVLASTNPQKVLIVKSPADNAEQKKFLGYEWSGAKGNEGIKYLGNSKTEIAPEAEDDDSRVLQNMQAKRIINTPLFDNNRRQNTDKIAYYIQQNFLLQKKYFVDENKNIRRDFLNEWKEPLTLPEHLQSYAAYADLRDLLDFSRKDFNKSFSLTPKKSVLVETKWELVRVEEFVSLIESGSRPQGGVGNISSGVWSLGGEHIHATNGTVDLTTPKYVPFDFFEQTTRGILQENDVLICKDGALTGKVALLRKELEGQKAMINEHLFIVRCNNLINQKYLFNFLFCPEGQELLKMNITGAAQGGLNSTNLKAIKIPVPHLFIQEKIVQECEAIDQAAESAKSEVEKAKKEIENVILGVFGNYPEKKLAELCLLNPSKTEIKNVDENTIVSFVEMASVSNDGFIAEKIDKSLKELKKGSYTYFAENDIIIAKITPCMENGKCALATNLTNGLGMGSSEFHVIRVKNEVLNKYIFALLNRETIRKEAEQNMTGSSGHRRVPANFYADYKLPVPPLSTQETLVFEIEKLELQIGENQELINIAKAKKEEVLKRYL